MWEMFRQVLLGLLGLSAGFAAAAGLFSFIIGLGVVSDFADRTHTGEHVLLYETSVALGGILGNVFLVYQVAIPGGGWLLRSSGWPPGSSPAAGPWPWPRS